MKKEIKNQDLNLELNKFNHKNDKEKDKPIQNINNLKKEVTKSNSILNYMDIFENSPLFEKKYIKKGQLLFNEGDIDNNIYLIKKGMLSVEKYTTILKNETKQLAILKSGEFLGEASLEKINHKKEAIIKAIEDSQVLAINGKNDLKRFVEENPTIGFELLKHIIIETNKRLLESNKIITSNGEFLKEINSLKDINQKNIFNLIDKIKNIVDVDYILYFEKHQIMTNFLILKYDTRYSNKIQNIIYEKSGIFLNLEELFKTCNINPNDKIIINKLSIGNEIYGYLIFGREKRIFTGSDKKNFSSLSNNLVGIIKKFFIDRDIRNKLYISEMKK